MNAIAVNAPPTCEARTGEIPGDYGFAPVWCLTRIGLRSYTDRNGVRRHYCAALGHRAAVATRYPERIFEGMDEDWDTRKARIDAAISADPDRP